MEIKCKQFETKYNDEISNQHQLQVARDEKQLELENICNEVKNKLINNIHKKNDKEKIDFYDKALNKQSSKYKGTINELHATISKIKYENNKTVEKIKFENNQTVDKIKFENNQTVDKINLNNEKMNQTLEKINQNIDKKFKYLHYRINELTEKNFLNDFLTLFAQIMSNLYCKIWDIINNGNLLNEYDIPANTTREYFFSFVSGKHKIPQFEKLLIHVCEKILEISYMNIFVCWLVRVKKRINNLSHLVEESTDENLFEELSKLVDKIQHLKKYYALKEKLWEKYLLDAFILLGKK
jgi:hypothetical protein